MMRLVGAKGFGVIQLLLCISALGNTRRRCNLRFLSFEGRCNGVEMRSNRSFSHCRRFLFALFPMLRNGVEKKRGRAQGPLQSTVVTCFVGLSFQTRGQPVRETVSFPFLCIPWWDACMCHAFTLPFHVFRVGRSTSTLHYPLHVPFHCLVVAGGLAFNPLDASTLHLLPLGIRACLCTLVHLHGFHTLHLGGRPPTWWCARAPLACNLRVNLFFTSVSPAPRKVYES